MEGFGDAGSSVKNPWERTVNHPLKKVIDLSSSDQFPLVPHHHIEEEYQQSSTAQNLEFLRNISGCMTETRKVRGQVRDYQLASRAPDLVRAEALQAKLKLVEALVHDLEISITSQKALTERLQQPYQGQHLKLEAQYHDNAISVFENISSSLSDCQEHIELLKWHKRHSLDELDRVSDSLKELSFRARKLQQTATQFKHP